MNAAFTTTPAGAPAANAPEQPSQIHGALDAMATMALPLFAVCGCALLLYLTRENRWRVLVKTVRERAALAICAGLIIVVWSVTVAPHDRYTSEVLNYCVSRGYVTLVGSCLSLIGVYRWITEVSRA